MLRTAFTDLVGADLPIAGFNRSPAVVAAVCNAGGLGVLAASGYRPDELDAQLTWIEEQTGAELSDLFDGWLFAKRSPRFD